MAATAKISESSRNLERNSIGLKEIDASLMNTLIRC